LLVGPEGARLAQQLVDQRRLAVVDMRDDRNVAKLHPEFSLCLFIVMAGLDPAIHGRTAIASRITWMAGSSPAMTHR
jgi:hypothetical protein